MSDPVENYINAVPFHREAEKAEIRKLVGRAIIRPRSSGIEKRKGFYYDYDSKSWKPNENTPFSN